jgi:hypothetical protein
VSLTAQFAVLRIAPGPRTRGEVAALAATSVAIPPAAIWHVARGLVRQRAVDPWQQRPAPSVAEAS